MSRRKEYTEELSFTVISELRDGKTFRCVAFENGISLGMVQRIWATRGALLVISEFGDGTEYVHDSMKHISYIPIA